MDKETFKPVPEDLKIYKIEAPVSVWDSYLKYVCINPSVCKDKGYCTNRRSCTE